MASGASRAAAAGANGAATALPTSTLSGRARNPSGMPTSDCTKVCGPPDPEIRAAVNERHPRWCGQCAERAGERREDRDPDRKPGNASEQKIRLRPPEATTELPAKPAPEPGPGRPRHPGTRLDIEQRPGDLRLDGGEAARHEGEQDQHRDDERRDRQTQAQAPHRDQGGEPHRPEHCPREQIRDTAIGRRLHQGSLDQVHLPPLPCILFIGPSCRSFPCTPKSSSLPGRTPIQVPGITHYG